MEAQTLFIIRKKAAKRKKEKKVTKVVPFLDTFIEACLCKPETSCKIVTSRKIAHLIMQ